MQADILLCDAATVRDGLLHVLGAGVTRLWRESYPSPLGLTLAILVTLQRSESMEEHKLRILLQDEDGEPVAQVAGAFGAKAGPGARPGESVAFPIVLNLAGLPVPKPGVYGIDILIDSHQIRSLVLQACLTSEKPAGQ